MKTHDTTLEIDAPAEQVWAVLTDFPAYGEWNTALPSLSGDLRVGSTLAMDLNLGGRPMAVTADVQELEPGRHFSWKGHLGTELLFKGERAFTVEPLGADRSRFRHVESISGLLSGPFLLVKGNAVAEHHHSLNASLKQRSEERASRAG